MNKCNSCGINIYEGTCPLCHTVTKKIDDEIIEINIYPNIPLKRRKFSLFLRILLFLCIVISVVSGIINYTLDFKYPWAVIIGSVLFYFYGLFYLLSDKYAGYMKRILLAIFWAVFFLLIIDIAFGFKRWSLNYVFPGALFILNITLIIFMIANRKNWQDYIVYLTSILLVAIAPLFLIFIGVVTKPLVNELAFLSCVFVFLGTLIIGGRTAKVELKRRFHI